MTLEDLLYKIGETAIKNKIINFSAVGGDIYDLNVENIKDYPVLFASPTGSHQVRENTTDYEVTFYFLDRLLSDSVNDVQIYSTAIEQLKLILNMVENMKGVLDVSDDYDIQNFTETERMNDRVAGAFSTVNITVKNENECCDTEFITLMLKLENKTLNVTKNGKYTVTYNKIYDGLRKVDVDVNVDLETPYNEGFADGKEEGLEQGYVSGKADGITEGYETGKADGLTEGYETGKTDGIAEGIGQGKELAAQEAVILDVADNGTVYTKFAEVPEWTKPSTGDDFYSYAKMTELIKTGINNDTVDTLELWWMYDENTPQNSGIFKCMGPFGFELEYYGNNQLELYVNGQYKYINVLPDVWCHIILKPGIGIWCNDAFYEITNNIGAVSEVAFGGTLGPSYFGMVKINDIVFIPTVSGFKNKNTSYLFPKPSIYEFYSNIKPTVVSELIKQVNVQVKINVEKEGVKLGNSTFSNIPSCIDFTGVSDLSYMFKDCFKLYDLSFLENVDVSNVRDMQYCFNQIGTNESELNYLPLANWDTSNVTEMSHMFERNHTNSLAGLENWNTSKVFYMNYMFQHNDNITDINALANWDTSNVTMMNYMFAYCYKLANIDALANWDTSNVTSMDGMLQYVRAVSMPAIDCSKIEQNKYPLYDFTTNETLTNVGGFLNAKSSWTNNYGLAKCPNLTRESCINILNGLFNFTAAGITPSYSQGKLKVHANFLNAVGSDISIATSKGWQVTA